MNDELTPVQAMLCSLRFNLYTTGADLAVQVLDDFHLRAPAATLCELCEAWGTARSVIALFADAGFPGLEDFPGRFDDVAEPVRDAASRVLVRRLVRGEITGAEAHEVLSILAQRGPRKCDEAFDAVERELFGATHG